MSAIEQPPIQFGGVQLQSLVPNAERQHANLKASPQPGPAGEGTPQARLLNVSRWAVAARIRQGVPLSEVLGHLQTLALLEESILSHQE